MMMMPLPSLLLLAIVNVDSIVCPTFSSVSPLPFQCRADSDCPTGYYCHENRGNRICEACLDCGDRFFRLPGPRPCARDHYDCGGCLKGYSARPLAAGEEGEKCVSLEYIYGGNPPPTTEPPMFKVDPETGDTWYSEEAMNKPLYIALGAVIAVVVVFSVSVLCIVRCIRQRAKRRAERERLQGGDHGEGGGGGEVTDKYVS